MFPKLLCSLIAFSFSLPVLAASTTELTATDLLNSNAGEPKAPFDQEQYLLGYQVYLARGNLSAAYFVARKAIRSQPNDADWLKRFAQVAEWVGLPSEALDAWLRCAEKTNDQTAWDSVGRLAPGLLNDNALLVYQQQLLRQHGDQELLINNIIQTYERLGRPIDGLNFLEGLARKNPNVTLLDAESRLAERAGQDDRAIALLTTLVHRHEPQENWVLRLAALYYLRGQFDDAWQVMHDIKPKMTAQAIGYWQVYAEISRLLHHDPEALHAYKILTDSGQARSNDLQNYAALLQPQDGLTAARLSELSYHKFGEEYSLVSALYLYQRVNLPKEALRLLNSLSSTQLETLEKNPEFIDQRAQIYWQNKNFDLARKDFLSGMKLAPKDARFLQGLIAVIIDQDDKPALTTILTTLHRRAIADPKLWSLWASGWALLEKPEQAIPFQQAYCRINPHDKLATLTLADYYASQNNMSEANRLRHSVFSLGAAALLNNVSSERLAQLREALFSQRLASATPDAALNMLRMRLQQPNAAKDTQLRDLILSWLLSHDSIDRARVWIDQNYQNKPPYWVAQTLALQDENRVVMRNLLDQHAEQLPRYDRIEAAVQSDLPHLGEQMAFDSLDRYPNDDEQAKRFQYLMSQRATWVDLSGQQLQQGVLSRSGANLSWSSFITEYWRLQLDALHDTQSSNNLTQLAPPPPLSTYRATLSQLSERGDWTFGVASHNALQRYLSATLGQTYQIENGVSLHWKADYNADSSESAALMAGGMKDALTTDFNWAITGRDYLGMQASTMNLKGQTGQVLGNGHVITMELGHHLFTKPNEQTFKLTATSAKYSANNNPLDTELLTLVPSGQIASSRFFVPQGYQQIGAYWDFGDYDPQVYERTWRGFGEFGISFSDTTGLGYSGRIGFHGPVLGYDRLSFSLEQAKGGRDSGDIFKQLLINYRYFY
jgi:predicted Zn-dependent protease